MKTKDLDAKLVKFAKENGVTERQAMLLIAGARADNAENFFWAIRLREYRAGFFIFLSGVFGTVIGLGIGAYLWQ